MENQNKLKISLIQYDIIWEDAEANQNYLNELLKDHKTDIIL